MYIRNICISYPNVQLLNDAKMSFYLFKLFLMYHDKSSSTRFPLRTRVIKGSAPRVETPAQAGTLDKEHFKQK